MKNGIHRVRDERALGAVVARIGVEVDGAEEVEMPRVVHQVVCLVLGVLMMVCALGGVAAAM